MCGICGIFSFSGPLQEVQGAVDAALEALKNRGPEVQASHLHKNVILGHTRLSIIDTSEAANQPFSDESGRYVIVYNGEIYNFRQLRQILISKGVDFRTSSDTEVLLKWLMEKGPEGIKDLKGFFAFAFFDKAEGTLLMARDRFGKKPLIYHHDGQKLVFGSEMKALFHLGIPREIDPVSLQIYFQLNYIPAPWSVYKNVKKLLPGYYLLADQHGIKQHRYYEIPIAEQHATRLSYSQAMDQLKEKMEAAVVKRLIADVPLGAFLSGGIDSSVVVALASRHVEKLKTFSIGFKDEPLFDETKYAQNVARMHHTEHTAFSLTNNDLLDCLYDVLDYTDEPFADSSALAVYILSRETRGKVTVALSGDGADEMFAGYIKHMAHFRMMQGGAGVWLLRHFHPLLAPLPQSRNSFLGNKVRQLYRFGKGAGMSPAQRYWRWAAFEGEDYALGLLNDAGAGSEYNDRKTFLTSSAHNDDSMNGILLNDMQLVLPNDMLTKVDLMSMANSLEVRVPFLDHDVVNLVFSMPDHYKIDATGRKRILRDAFRDVLPPELYHRPKQGFEVPLLPWFRKELKDQILNGWLNDDFVREQGLFNGKVINKLKRKLFSSNPGEIHAQIWALVVFQHWYKKYHIQF